MSDSVPPVAVRSVDVTKFETDSENSTVIVAVLFDV